MVINNLKQKVGVMEGEFHFLKSKLEESEGKKLSLMNEKLSLQSEMKAYQE